jgi:hypothetical protein
MVRQPKPDVLAPRTKRFRTTALPAAFSLRQLPSSGKKQREWLGHLERPALARYRLFMNLSGAVLSVVQRGMITQCPYLTRVGTDTDVGAAGIPRCNSLISTVISQLLLASRLAASDLTG